MELLLAIFLSALTVFVAIAFYYGHDKAEVPHEFSERRKLYVLHYLLNFAFGMATFLDKVGIVSEVHFLRATMENIPPLKDKHLLIKDLRFERVKVRIYQCKTSNTSQRRGVLYFHGGVGWLGSIRAYERTCRYLARKSNSVVVSVGPKLRAQILIYPFLQCVDFNLPSYQQNERIPILLKERTLVLGLKYMNKDLSVLPELFKGRHVPEDLRPKYQKWVSPDYIPQEFKTRGYKPSPTYPSSEEIYAHTKGIFDPVFSPLLAEDSVVAQVPETFLLTCEFDVLRDDGLLYKKRLEDHGIKVTWCHLQEGFHGTVFSATLGGGAAFKSGIKGLDKVVNFLRLM
ncbi:arylacetamide deacetylase-like 4 [Manacus vitellinus]|uniref:arylacetamide deacetylase-like 4 n=1 Tax=Manacus vitellinus TaxID=328815 RepID=UPI00115DC348|nr:arylacetamide deacetylase-like 4 [Manacus vitellinus]